MVAAAVVGLVLSGGGKLEVRKSTWFLVWQRFRNFWFVFICGNLYLCVLQVTCCHNN